MTEPSGVCQEEPPQHVVAAYKHTHTEAYTWEEIVLCTKWHIGLYRGRTEPLACSNTEACPINDGPLLY